MELNCHYSPELMYLENLPPKLKILDCSKLWKLKNMVLPQELTKLSITVQDINIVINECVINPYIIYITRPFDSRVYYSKFYTSGSGPPLPGLVKIIINGCDVSIHTPDYST